MPGMSATVRKLTTLTQCLAWEEGQESRDEFDGLQPVAMNGGTVAHDQITFNVRRALDARLVGKPCRPFGPRFKIFVDGHIRYPHALVVCQPVSPTATVIDDPVIVFEVLSDSTANFPGACQARRDAVAMYLF